MAKPRVTKHEGETIIERPNMIRCRYTLSNGQLLSVFFARKRANSPMYGICYVWSVAIHIGRNRKEANRWFQSRNHAQDDRQTGQCGLEGLRIALRYILQFAESICVPNAEMQIAWTDDKRMRAYRYLLRFPGFIFYEDQGNPQCIAYRNPDIYEWVGSND
jgi:hypothetical protein